MPHGCILSVTLFCLEINSIVKILPAYVSCCLYVDDFLLCYKSKYTHIIERHFQQYLNKLYSRSLYISVAFLVTRHILSVTFRLAPPKKRQKLCLLWFASTATERRRRFLHVDLVLSHHIIIKESVEYSRWHLRFGKVTWAWLENCDSLQSLLTHWYYWTVGGKSAILYHAVQCVPSSEDWSKFLFRTRLWLACSEDYLLTNTPRNEGIHSFLKDLISYKLDKGLLSISVPSTEIKVLITFICMKTFLQFNQVFVGPSLLYITYRCDFIII